MAKTWFITGASRGLGKSLARALLQRGDRVAATARDTSTLDDLKELGADRLWTAQLDVTDGEACGRVVKDAFAHFGRIEVLVNNAGYGLRGAAEEASAEQVRRQVETNLIAPMTLTRAFLPYLREQGEGYIVQISSVGGQAAFASLSAYHATKWGLEGYSEALAQEVAAFGVKVMIVEPGGIRTDWAGSSMDHTQPLPAYADAPFRQPPPAPAPGTVRRNGNPDKMANAIIDAVESADVPLRLPLGGGAWDRLKMLYQTRGEALQRWEQIARESDDEIPVQA